MYEDLETEKIEIIRESKNAYDIGFVCGKLNLMDQILNLLQIPYDYDHRGNATSRQLSGRDV
jgi:hypothetical protein